MHARTHARTSTRTHSHARRQQRAFGAAGELAGSLAQRGNDPRHFRARPVSAKRGAAGEQLAAPPRIGQALPDAGALLLWKGRVCAHVGGSWGAVALACRMEASASRASPAPISRWNDYCCLARSGGLQGLGADDDWSRTSAQWRKVTPEVSSCCNRADP